MGTLFHPPFYVQLGKELESKGILLQPALNSTLTPMPLFSGDKSLMDLALQHYNCAVINRCQVFLQVISTCNLLIFNTDTIHPAYLEGHLPSLRISNITWLALPCPPKSYWQVWNQFLSHHIIPFLSSMETPGFNLPSWRYSPVFFKHRHSMGLYMFDGKLTLYKIRPKTRTKRQVIYINVPYQCSIKYVAEGFFPVHTHNHEKDILVVGQWYNSNKNPIDQSSKTLLDMIHDLHPS